MGVFKDLLGTTKSLFKLGIGGPQLKRDTDEISVRDTNDTQYAYIRAALFRTFGNDFELNAGASGAGDDWAMTLTRPGTGMTHNLQIVLPSGDPAPGQVLGVASFAGDTITLGYITVAGGDEKLSIDTTALAFGDSSPVAMFTKPANNLVRMVRVYIDTPFDGSPSLAVGIAGTTSKYMPSTAVDLNAAAGTVFEYDPGLPPEVGAEALIATYAGGGATVGAARIQVDYAAPN